MGGERPGRGMLLESTLGNTGTGIDSHPANSLPETRSQEVEKARNQIQRD